jgi:hypothetical protein
VRSAEALLVLCEGLREAMLADDEPVGRRLVQALTSIVAETRSTIGPRMTQGYSRPNTLAADVIRP